METTDRDAPTPCRNRGTPGAHRLWDYTQTGTFKPSRAAVVLRTFRRQARSGLGARRARGDARNAVRAAVTGPAARAGGSLTAPPPACPRCRGWAPKGLRGMGSRVGTGGR